MPKSSKQRKVLRLRVAGFPTTPTQKWCIVPRDARTVRDFFSTLKVPGPWSWRFELDGADLPFDQPVEILRKGDVLDLVFDEENRHLKQKEAVLHELQERVPRVRASNARAASSSSSSASSSESSESSESSHSSEASSSSSDSDSDVPERPNAESEKVGVIAATVETPQDMVPSRKRKFRTPESKRSRNIRNRMRKKRRKAESALPRHAVDETNAPPEKVPGSPVLGKHTMFEDDSQAETEAKGNDPNKRASAGGSAAPRVVSNIGSIPCSMDAEPVKEAPAESVAPTGPHGETTADPIPMDDSADIVLSSKSPVEDEQARSGEGRARQMRAKSSGTWLHLEQLRKSCVAPGEPQASIAIAKEAARDPPVQRSGPLLPVGAQRWMDETVANRRLILANAEGTSMKATPPFLDTTGSRSLCSGLVDFLQFRDRFVEDLCRVEVCYYAGHSGSDGGGGFVTQVRVVRQDPLQLWFRSSCPLAVSGLEGSLAQFGKLVENGFESDWDICLDPVYVRRFCVVEEPLKPTNGKEPVLSLRKDAKLLNSGESIQKSDDASGGSLCPAEPEKPCAPSPIVPSAGLPIRPVRADDDKNYSSMLGESMNGDAVQTNTGCSAKLDSAAVKSAAVVHLLDKDDCTGTQESPNPPGTIQSEDECGSSEGSDNPEPIGHRTPTPIVPSVGLPIRPVRSDDRKNKSEKRPDSSAHVESQSKPGTSAMSDAEHRAPTPIVPSVGLPIRPVRADDGLDVAPPRGESSRGVTSELKPDCSAVLNSDRRALTPIVPSVGLPIRPVRADDGNDMSPRRTESLKHVTSKPKPDSSAALDPDRVLTPIVPSVGLPIRPLRADNTKGMSAESGGSSEDVSSKPRPDTSGASDPDRVEIPSAVTRFTPRADSGKSHSRLEEDSERPDAVNCSEKHDSWQESPLPHETHQAPEPIVPSAGLPLRPVRADNGNDTSPTHAKRPKRAREMKLDNPAAAYAHSSDEDWESVATSRCAEDEPVPAPSVKNQVLDNVRMPSPDVFSESDDSETNSTVDKKADGKQAIQRHSSPNKNSHQRDHGDTGTLEGTDFATCQSSGDKSDLSRAGDGDSDEHMDDSPPEEDDDEDENENEPDSSPEEEQGKSSTSRSMLIAAKGDGGKARTPNSLSAASLVARRNASPATLLVQPSTKGTPKKTGKNVPLNCDDDVVMDTSDDGADVDEDMDEDLDAYNEEEDVSEGSNQDMGEDLDEEEEDSVLKGSDTDMASEPGAQADADLDADARKYFNAEAEEDAPAEVPADGISGVKSRKNARVVPRTGDDMDKDRKDSREKIPSPVSAPEQNPHRAVALKVNNKFVRSCLNGFVDFAHAVEATMKRLSASSHSPGCGTVVKRLSASTAPTPPGTKPVSASVTVTHPPATTTKRVSSSVSAPQPRATTTGVVSVSAPGPRPPAASSRLGSALALAEFPPTTATKHLSALDQAPRLPSTTTKRASVASPGPCPLAPAIKHEPELSSAPHPEAAAVQRGPGSNSLPLSVTPSAPSIPVLSKPEGVFRTSFRLPPSADKNQIPRL